MKEFSNKPQEGSNGIPWWVKSIIMLSITAVFCYKLIITPFNLEFDFPSFLSLLLALFSVALAALFYFKATDTSNAFYDNTYKFSQEIAGLLVKIESGFGEKLSHLDETYKGMRESFDKFPGRIEVKDAKKELKQGEKEVAKILSDKEQLINELLDKAQLREEEKSKFLYELGAKEAALQEAQSEIHFLRRKLSKSENIDEIPLIKRNIDHSVINFFNHRVIDVMGPDNILNSPPNSLRKKFRRMIEELPPEFVDYLKQYGIISDNYNITPDGVEFIRAQANIVKKESEHSS
ncbi:MAG: hypothetical protein Q7O12_09350 [Deltaproteobacteria bacterium]|nr:hypothetical protein [Deltaproteobacteria bacterium]